MDKNTKVGLPERLLELRGDMTQAECAHKLGLLQQTYARWETGDRQPKLQDLVALASHFGVSTDWLLGVSNDRASVSSASQNGVKRKIAQLKSNAEEIAMTAQELLARIDKMERGL